MTKQDRVDMNLHFLNMGKEVELMMLKTIKWSLICDDMDGMQKVLASINNLKMELRVVNE